MSVVETDLRFWDCECEGNYIQSKKTAQCTVCGAQQDDQPDSRVEEVSAARTPEQPKPVDMEVLIGSGLCVKSPNSDLVKLDDECEMSVFELEDHRYEIAEDDWLDSGYFEGDEKFVDKLFEAGFEVYTNTYFKIYGPRDGYCWPWEVSERHKEKPKPLSGKDVNDLLSILIDDQELSVMAAEITEAWRDSVNASEIAEAFNRKYRKGSTSEREQPKVVDFDVLIESGLFVQNPHGEFETLTEDCPVTIWELEDHQYKPSDDRWYREDDFEEGFVDKLREAGFNVHVRGADSDFDNAFYISGLREGYCWPWEKSERQVEKPNPVKLVVTEMELWLDHYDKDSEIYADLCNALDALRKSH